MYHVCLYSRNVTEAEKEFKEISKKAKRGLLIPSIHLEHRPTDKLIQGSSSDCEKLPSNDMMRYHSGNIACLMGRYVAVN